MSALAPLYLKKAYVDEPFFNDSKIVLAINDNEYKTPFGTKFAQKLLIDGVSPNDVRSIAGFPVGYEELMRLAVDYSDAVVFTTPNINQRLMNYVETSRKPIMPYKKDTPNTAYLDFYNSLL